MKRFTIQIFTLLLLITLAVPAFAGRVLAEIEYFYADDGTLIGKAFNGKRVNFEYDLRGQLRAVKDAQGKDLERYTYDPAGNRLSKTINGVTTAYTYDKANQLVTSTVNGVTTHYKYDAAGRMIQAGDKKYIYNGNNKVVAIWQNGDIIAKFEYNIGGQISKAIYGDKVEEFMWDGLALIWRSGVTYINEPYVTGGNPVMAGDDVLFNDMLGSTLAVNGKAVEMTSFGETADKNAFFTGKPMIDELGYSFLFRDYNPNQGKWTTTDPLGYPDGWNNLAYCGNSIIDTFDLYGAKEVIIYVGGAGEGSIHHAGKKAMDKFYGSDKYHMFYWTQESEIEDFINKQSENDKIILIGHSYGGDTAENVAHDITDRTIDKLITLDPVSFWDFSGSKPESVNNWYNVIAEDDKYTWNDFIADVGGQWGEESGAVNYVCPTDHNNPYAMLMLLKGKGILE